LTITVENFRRKGKGYADRVFTAARDETAALTEAIAKVEKEIDEQVAGLYRL